MSAIFGLVKLNQAPAVPEHLERMNAALMSHGPEAAGLWMSGEVGLGHRLLSVTPQDRLERQPLVGAGGQAVLVFDGRIDNRDELAPNLKIGGPLADVPDSALAMRAYERWGQACLQHLVGAFTLAVWNAPERSLMLARSPIASPSLFYYATPQTLAFATMPKGLFALPFIARQLNEEYLADYLAAERTEPGASLYKDLRRLLPGQMLIVRRDSWAAKTFWQPDSKRELRFSRDEEYVEAFNELLERVIGDHLRSLTPAGVMMSGGFDSTAIAATAARLLQSQGGRLAAFTEVPRAGFEGPMVPDRYADETPYVQAMAQRYSNLDPHLVYTDGRVYLEDLKPFFQAAEVPFRNASNRVWYEAILRRAGQGGVRVLLDGSQGNLTLSWSGAGLLSQWVRVGHWGQVWREARAMAQSGQALSPAAALLGQGVLPLLPTGLVRALAILRHPSQAARNGPRAHSPIHPDFARSQRVDDRAREKGRTFEIRNLADTRALRARVVLATTVLSDGLNCGYQALFGVTTRQPASDVRLFEFCLAVPEEQYQHKGQTRWLFRRAMAERLPPEILANPKRGLQAADWFERLCRAQAQVLEVLTRLEQSDLAKRALDLPRLRRLAEDLPRAASGPTQLLADSRGVLDLGLMTGCFIRWVETGQA